MDSEKIQHLKDEIQQKLLEGMPNLNSVIEKYGVLGAVEVEFKLDTTRLQSRLELVDDPQGQEILSSALATIKDQKVETATEESKLSLACFRYYCPCMPGDHPNDCCWRFC